MPFLQHAPQKPSASNIEGFPQNSKEIAEIVGGQNVGSMHIKRSNHETFQLSTESSAYYDLCQHGNLVFTAPSHTLDNEHPGCVCRMITRQNKAMIQASGVCVNCSSVVCKLFEHLLAIYCSCKCDLKEGEGVATSKRVCHSPDFVHKAEREMQVMTRREHHCNSSSQEHC